MNTLTLNRLFKVFHKIGLSISKTDNVYHISRTNQPELQGADVLLPPGYLLDKKAIQQLMAFAEVKHPAGGEVKAAFATPDIHPGSLVPVGAVVATTQDMIIPQAIGTDIHCGMRLHGSDLTLDQFLSVKEKVVQKLKGDLLLGTRELPIRATDFRALFEYGLLGWVDQVSHHPLGQLKMSDFSQLFNECDKIYALGGEKGSLKWIPDYLLDSNRDVIRDSYLATIGGGNHLLKFNM